MRSRVDVAHVEIEHDERLDQRRAAAGGFPAEDRGREQRVQGGALGVLPGQTDAHVDGHDRPGAVRVSGLVREEDGAVEAG